MRPIAALMTLALSACGPERQPDALAPDPAPDPALQQPAADLAVACATSPQVAAPDIRFPRDGTTGRRSATLHVSNPGPCPLPLTLALEGSPAFGLHDEALQLAPGEAAAVEVTFANPDQGPHEGALVLHGPGEPQRVPLRGDLDGPCIGAPSRIDVGTVPVGASASLDAGALWLCGTQPVEVRGVLRDQDPALRVGLWGDFSLAPDGAPLPINVEFQPDTQRPHRSRVTLVTDDPLRPRVTIDVHAVGGPRTCPVAEVTAPEVIHAAPLDVLTLDGSASTRAGQRLEYEWVVLDRPDGSTAQPGESFFNNASPADGSHNDDLATPTAQMFLDMAGRFVFGLTVRDEFGVDSLECDQQAVVVVHAVPRPDDNLVATLTWDGDRPEGALWGGVDLDLELHPLGEAEPCSADSRSPGWATERWQCRASDATTGGGPEVIELVRPGAPAYALSVRYANARDTPGEPVEATVRVTTADGRVAVRSAVIEAPGDHWDVGTLQLSDLSWQE